MGQCVDLQRKEFQGIAQCCTQRPEIQAVSECESQSEFLAFNPLDYTPQLMLKSHRKNAQTILVKQATTSTLKILKVFELPNPLQHLPVIEGLVKAPVPNTVEPEACCVQNKQTYVLLEHLPKYSTIRNIKNKQDDFDFDEKIVSDMVS